MGLSIAGAAIILCASLLCDASASPRPVAVDEAATVSELRRAGSTIELNDQGRAISLSWESGTEHKFDNTNLQRAASLKHLKELWLEHSDVTDSGLRELRSMSQLETLALICKYERGRPARITDEGLVHLQGLTNLRVLRLDDSDVTDKGLVHLRMLRKLEELDLFGTNISDAGLIHLQGLSNLTYLNISETQR